MYLSAQMTLAIAVLFAIACGSVAVTGFMSLGDLTDPKTHSDALGFAWFWTFLTLVAVVFGAISWRIMRKAKPPA